MRCEHHDFAANVEVGRIQDGEGGPVVKYMADVRIVCADCGTPFRFIGLPSGVDYKSPMVSVNGEELRAPIAPQGEVASVLEGGDDVGFTIRKVL